MTPLSPPRLACLLPLLLIGGMLASCDSPLDLTEDPTDFYAPENVFTSAAAADNVVEGTYATLAEELLYGQALGTLAMADDFQHFNSSWDWREGEWSVSEREFEAVWRSHYTGIGRANFALQGLEGAELAAEVRDRLRGEVLFMRAYYYFNLVRAFGRVPLVLEPPRSGSDEERLFPVQAEPAAVFEQIIADLQRAADLLPARSAQEPGRVARGAAQTLLAKVHLWIGSPGTDVAVPGDHYADACGLARTVIASGEWALEPDVVAVYSTANERGAEWMHRVPATNDWGSTHQWLGLTAPAGLRERPAPPDIAAMQPDDADVFGGHWGIWGLDNEDVDDVFGDTKEQDERFTRLTWNEYINPETNESEGNFRGRYLIKKYYWLSETLNHRLTNLDLPLLRYAHTLLIAAEACQQTGDAGFALEQLNKVRTRAGLDPLGAITLEDVLAEREREFVGEFEDRWDLVRNGRYLEAMAAEEGDNWTGSQAQLLYPIPQDEIDRNPNLTQNLGY